MKPSKLTVLKRIATALESIANELRVANQIAIADRGRKP